MPVVASAPGWHLPAACAAVAGVLLLGCGSAGAELAEGGVPPTTASTSPDPAPPAPSAAPATTAPATTAPAAVYRGYPLRVASGREVRIGFADHGVGEVRFTAPERMVVDVFVGGSDRGVVLRTADGDDLGYLFPVGGVGLPRDAVDGRVPAEAVADLDAAGVALTAPGRFPGVTVEPVAGTSIGPVAALLVDLVGAGAPSPTAGASAAPTGAREDIPHVLRVAPRARGVDLETQVWVGPAPGTTERAWLLDVGGTLWAYVSAGGGSAVDTGHALVLSLRFEPA